MEFAELAIIIFIYSVCTKQATNVNFSSVIQGHTNSTGNTAELTCKAGRR